MLERAARLIDGLVRTGSAEYWDLAAPGSDLAKDDELTQPAQLSHFVGHCLSMAEDQLRAVRILITDHQRDKGFLLPMSAHYANLRSAFESASLAIWLLAPEERAERVRRCVQFRQYELAHERALYLAITTPPAGASKAEVKQKQKERQEAMKRQGAHKKSAREVAARNGLDLGTLPQFPSFGEVADAASIAMGIERGHGSAIWQTLSGLSHPSSQRLVNFADMDIQEDEGDTVKVRFTAKLTTLSTMMIAAASHFRAAVTLTEARGRA